MTLSSLFTLLLMTAVVIHAEKTVEVEKMLTNRPNIVFVRSASASLSKSLSLSLNLSKSL
jgi:hypothetical protein